MTESETSNSQLVLKRAEDLISLSEDRIDTHLIRKRILTMMKKLYKTIAYVSCLA